MKRQILGIFAVTTLHNWANGETWIVGHNRSWNPAKEKPRNHSFITSGQNFLQKEEEDLCHKCFIHFCWTWFLCHINAFLTMVVCIFIANAKTSHGPGSTLCCILLWKEGKVFKRTEQGDEVLIKQQNAIDIFRFFTKLMVLHIHTHIPTGVLCALQQWRVYVTTPSVPGQSVDFFFYQRTLL